jgi:chromosome segregation ATPase
MEINLTKDIDINNSVQRQIGNNSPKTPAKTSSSKNSAQKKAGDDIKFYLYLDYRMFQINKKFKTTLIQINTLEDLSDILDNRMKNTIADIKSSVSNIAKDVTISSSIHSQMFQKGVKKLIHSVREKIKAEEEPDDVIMAPVVDADDGDVVKKVEEIDLQEQLAQQKEANIALQEQLTQQQQVNADLQEQHQQANTALQEQHQQANTDLQEQLRQQQQVNADLQEQHQQANTALQEQHQQVNTALQEQLTQQQQAIAALQDELATALKDINQYQRGAKEKETTTGKRKGR